MKRNIISALLALAILLALATPALAAGNETPAATCQYGTTQYKDSAGVIHARCLSWLEYRAKVAADAVKGEWQYATARDKQLIKVLINGKYVQCRWVQNTPIGPVCHK